MRLIDADELLYEDITDENGNTYMVVHAPQIDNAPTIEAVEVVKGNLLKSSPHTAKCSVCGHVTTECDANFCPNCGIRFDVEYFGLCMNEDDLK